VPFLSFPTHSNPLSCHRFTLLTNILVQNHIGQQSPLPTFFRYKYSHLLHNVPTNRYNTDTAANKPVTVHIITSMPPVLNPNPVLTNTEPEQPTRPTRPSQPTRQWSWEHGDDARHMRWTPTNMPFRMYGPPHEYPVVPTHRRPRESESGHRRDLRLSDTSSSSPAEDTDTDAYVSRQVAGAPTTNPYTQAPQNPSPSTENAHRSGHPHPPIDTEPRSRIPRAPSPHSPALYAPDTDTDTSSSSEFDIPDSYRYYRQFRRYSDSSSQTPHRSPSARTAYTPLPWNPAPPPGASVRSLLRARPVVFEERLYARGNAGIGNVGAGTSFTVTRHGTYHLPASAPVVNRPRVGDRVTVPQRSASPGPSSSVSSSMEGQAGKRERERGRGSGRERGYRKRDRWLMRVLCVPRGRSV
jgi:hypothetical protein